MQGTEIGVPMRAFGMLKAVGALMGRAGTCGNVRSFSKPVETRQPHHEKPCPDLSQAPQTNIQFRS